VLSVGPCSDGRTHVAGAVLRILTLSSCAARSLLKPVVDPLELFVEKCDVTLEYRDFATELRNAFHGLYVAF